MNELKSVLIDKKLHEELKRFSVKTGLKIKSITEQSIKEFIKEDGECLNGKS